jgi:hypothetical protein
MAANPDALLRDVLEYGTIAVVGCSSTRGKDAHEIPRYLLEHDFDVVPVNPNATEIFGRRAFDSLGEVDRAIDVVDVFRPSDEVAGIVDEAIARGDVRAIWTQLGIGDDVAASRAEDAGLAVVQNECIMVEHRRLFA